MNEKFPEVEFIEAHGLYKIYIDDRYYELNREELKSFRNSIHNLLLDLNRELNYED